MFAEIYLNRTNPNRTWCPCSSGKMIHNSCMVVGSDDTDQGYKYLEYGSANPDTLNKTVKFYSFSWKKDGSSPLITIGFGENGDEQYSENTDVLALTNNVNGLACWSKGILKYVFSDQDTVDELIASGDDSRFCVYFNDRLVLEPFVSIKNNGICVVNADEVIMNRSK